MNTFLGKDIKIICLVSKITSTILIMATSRPKTRSATDHWLVGQEARLLQSKVLPTSGDVLKEVLFKRNVPENKTVDLMSLVSVGEVTTRVLLCL